MQTTLYNLKKTFLLSLLVFAFGIFKVSAQNATAEIKWLTLQEVEEAQKQTPKLVFVDLYTSWCVWCDKMNESTFSDPNIISYINEHFYPVKFDAEGNNTVHFKGKDYALTKINNRNVHQLAWDWGSVNNRIGYPTIVVLDGQLNKIQAFPGFKDADAMKSLIHYYGDNIYQTKSWQDYLSSGK